MAEKTTDSPAVTNSPKSPTLKGKGTKSPQKSNPKSPTMTSPAAQKSAPNLKLDHHVARPGFEEVFVVMHGATSLPSRSDGQDPVPFASLKSIADERGMWSAQGATHATVQATHSPTWEEVLMMEVKDDTAEEEEIILTISDSVSKEKLVTYRIPLKNLVPFHSYHFELVQPTKSITSGIRAYATIQRRSSYLPRLQDFGFCGLEVVLRGFHRQLSTPAGSLLAVARIVPDYSAYKDAMLLRRAAGITTTTVTFPSPHPSAFGIPDEQMQGFPQLTTTSKGSLKPTWEHPFMFSSKDTATMFTHNSALVVEYYAATSSMSSVTWAIRSPIGFSTLLLDDDVFRALTSEAGRLGVRVDDLMIQSSQFETEEGAYPSVDLSLRLIHTERPDSLVTAAQPSILPLLDSMPVPGSVYNPLLESDNPGGNIPHRGKNEPHEEGGLLDISGLDSAPGTQAPLDHPEPPRIQKRRTEILVKEDEYPPSDIFQTILPENLQTENDIALGYIGTPDKRSLGHQKGNETMDNNASSLVSHQARELQHYREAVKRMSGDIVRLRDDVNKLQNENHNLRRELMLHKELGELVRNDIDSGIVSSEEVADKFVAVKTKLTEETDELKKYKTKVQHLQNLLIKANEREKKYLTDTKAARNQDSDLRRAQDKLQKMRKLEETCVQQEKVIEKMEKLLNKYLKQSDDSRKNRNGGANDYEGPAQVTSLLTQENARLRMEVDSMKLQERHSDAEKAQLMAKLERAENRVTSLESQLEHNSRRWARERHELTVRLQEHRNGFMRNTGGGALGFSQPDSIMN